MGKGYSQKEVEEIFAKDGYIVNSNYENSKIHILVTCPKKHTYRCTLNGFNNGFRCMVCSGNKKYSQKEVEEIFAKDGYIVNSLYKNNKTKLFVTCPIGHNWSTHLNGFNNGFRCQECSGNRKHTQEEVVRMLGIEGYIVKGEYKNNKIPFSVVCPQGHEYGLRLNDFIGNVRCPECSGNRKRTQKEVEEIFAKERYFVKGEYRSNHTPIWVICPKNHEYMPTLANFQNGNRCPRCSFIGTSRPEIEIFDLVKSYFPSAKKIRDMKVKIEGKPHIHGFDIDCFVPELMLGIEYDGPYWHDFEGLKFSRPDWPDEDVHNYHPLKDNHFLGKGIKILHITGEEWEKDKQACLKRCLEFLGINNGL